MLPRHAVLGMAATAVLFAGVASYANATQTILIGGGSEGDLHTQAASHICRLVNEHLGDEYGCLARSAPGSVFKIRAVEIGLMEFGLVRSDRAREAVIGSGAWEGSPAANLRSVLMLAPEPVLLVTSANVAENLVHDVVRTVFENLGSLREAHTALRGLDPSSMLDDLTAPLHPGAARYYRDQGWL